MKLKFKFKLIEIHWPSEQLGKKRESRRLRKFYSIRFHFIIQR